MGIITLLAVYLVTWWIVFLGTLPLWVRKQNKKVKGADRGAPDNPRLWKKAGLTSVLSAILVLLFYLAYEYSGLSIYNYEGTL